MRTICLPLIALILSATMVKADDVIPKRPEFARYEAMLNRSPFAVATAGAAPVAAPDFARDLYIANAARSRDGDMVTIGSTADKNFKKYLTTRQPVDGYSISNMEWSSRVGETKVTITKDGQYATLTFNQSLLSQPLPNPAQPNLPQPPQPIPGIGQPPNYVKPAPIPALPSQTLTSPAPGINRPATQNRPHVRGVIQRNPPAVTPTPYVPPPPPPAPDTDEG